jgi:hypothetical protein
MSSSFEVSFTQDIPKGSSSTVWQKLRQPLFVPQHQPFVTDAQIVTVSTRALPMAMHAQGVEEYELVVRESHVLTLCTHCMVDDPRRMIRFTTNKGPVTVVSKFTVDGNESQGTAVIKEELTVWCPVILQPVLRSVVKSIHQRTLRRIAVEFGGSSSAADPPATVLKVHKNATIASANASVAPEVVS